MSTMNVDQGAKAIQTDWETREFLEIISVNMKKLTEFVNKFGLLSFLHCLISLKTYPFDTN